MQVVVTGAAGLRLDIEGLTISADSGWQVEIADGVIVCTPRQSEEEKKKDFFERMNEGMAIVRNDPDPKTTVHGGSGELALEALRKPKPKIGENIYQEEITSFVESVSNVVSLPVAQEPEQNAADIEVDALYDPANPTVVCSVPLPEGKTSSDYVVNAAQRRCTACEVVVMSKSQWFKHKGKCADCRGASVLDTKPGTKSDRPLCVKCNLRTQKRHNGMCEQCYKSMSSFNNTIKKPPTENAGEKIWGRVCKQCSIQKAGRWIMPDGICTSCHKINAPIEVQGAERGGCKVYRDDSVKLP